jgi:hypothetical protein
MLRRLTELYARRAREYSETVARLGTQFCVRPELFDLMLEIRRKRRLCDEAEEKFDRYLKEVSGGNGAGGSRRLRSKLDR